MTPAAVSKRQEMVQLLRMQTEGNANPTLLQAMAHGVAFHHAGLTPDERGLVEQVCVCVCALLAGNADISI